MNVTSIAKGLRRGWSRLALVGLWFALPCCASHCAGTSDHFAEQRAASWEFRAPPQRTWRELVEMLAAEGVRGLPEAPPFGNTVEGRVSANHVVRVRFAGSPEAYSVEALHSVSSRDADGGERVFNDHRTSPALLWRLVQRVEPDRARGVRRTADARAERSRAAWTACDRFWERSLAPELERDR